MRCGPDLRGRREEDMMRYTRLVAVVGALLLVAGFSAGAAPEPEEPITVEIDTVAKPSAKPDWLSVSTEEDRLCISTESKIETANTDDPDYDDPCVECWLGCHEAFRKCRKDCGPFWDPWGWGHWNCFDDCVDLVIECEQSCPCP